MINSLLDRPCVVFPVGHVDPAKDPKVELKEPYTGLPGDVDKDYWDRCKFQPQPEKGIHQVDGRCTDKHFLFCVIMR